MQELVHELSNRNQEELIKRHFTETIETMRSNYHKFLVDYLIENGVRFKSDKKFSEMLHEQEVQKWLKQQEEMNIENESSDEYVVDLAEMFGKKKGGF